MYSNIWIVVGRVEKITGAPRRLVLLSRLLIGKGHTVTLLGSKSSELETICHQQGVSLEFMFFRKFRPLSGKLRGLKLMLSLLTAPFYVLYQNLSLYWKTKSAKPDVLIIRGSRNVVGTAVLVKLLTNTKVVWDIGYEPASTGAYRLVHKLSYWASDRVIGQYKGVLADFQRGCGGRNLSKVYSVFPAIDLITTDVNVGSKRSLKRKKNVKLLHVGTLCNRKNQLFSIELVAKLVELLPQYNIHLNLVGGCQNQKYVSVLNQMIVDNTLTDKVSLEGWSDNVYSYMSDADVLLMPSKEEGVSNTIQEAMREGLPVVSSNVGGASELLHNRVSGFVLDDFELEVWAQCIKELILDISLYEAVSKSSKEFAKRNFSQENWVLNYQRVIQFEEPLPLDE